MPHSNWDSTINNLQRQIQTLEELVSQAQYSQSDEVKQALARFLVVRTSGYLEQVVSACIREYLTHCSSPAVTNFGLSWLTHGLSPKPDQLIKLVGRFDNGMAESLKSFLDKEDALLRRELTFLVDRRNKIAHGVNESVGIRKALDLLEYSRRITKWFICNLGP